MVINHNITSMYIYYNIYIDVHAKCIKFKSLKIKNKLPIRYSLKKRKIVGPVPDYSLGKVDDCQLWAP